MNLLVFSLYIKLWTVTTVEIMVLFWGWVWPKESTSRVPDGRGQ